ncbi:helix-turn-helix domain-containing protein [Actinopolymorpha alba]|uniref:response regulator transcription factor n=1 Tax=Actinopolymorpha alba TaxID=533267 RepID=UPI0009FE5D67
MLGSCLTVSEVKVVELAAAGRTNDQIGRELSLSSHTVAAYLAEAMRRVGARNRAELVARCYVSGVLDVGQWPPCAVAARGKGGATGGPIVNLASSQ